MNDKGIQAAVPKYAALRTVAQDDRAKKIALEFLVQTWAIIRQDGDAPAFPMPSDLRYLRSDLPVFKRLFKAVAHVSLKKGVQQNLICVISI